MHQTKMERPTRRRRSPHDERHDSAESLHHNTNRDNLSPGNVLMLQRTMGNSYVQRVLAEATSLTQVQIQAAIKYNNSQGFSEDQIKKIQEITGTDKDGDMGPNTVRAIAAWQTSHGLDADGKVGPTTYKAITQPPKTQTEAKPVAEKPKMQEEPSVLDTIVEWGQGASAWSEGMWNSMMDYFEDDKQSAKAAATPGAATKKQPNELETIMLKPRLNTTEIRRARELIKLEMDEKRRGDLYIALQGKVHYHSQRDNQSKDDKGKSLGDVMCNLTSLAMVLEYLGVDNPDPTMQYEDALEKIRVEKKLPARTTQDGWGGVAKEMGVEHEMLAWTAVKGKAWYMEKILPELRSGKAVMFSITGHIVRLQNVTEDGLVVDDPYGKETLLAGTTHKWQKTNAKDGKSEGWNAGEDNVWPWAEVSKHSMLWLASFKAK